jgi:hypothetical protein
MGNNPTGKSNQTSEELSANGARGQKARKVRSNRWLKRRDEKDREAIRERIKTDMLCSQLERAAAGEIELSPTQVQAAKVLLDKTLPSLQAVEQTQIEAPKDEGEILGALTHLLSQNPSLLRQLADADPGLRAALKSAIEGVPSVVDVQQRSAA